MVGFIITKKRISNILLCLVLLVTLLCLVVFRASNGAEREVLQPATDSLERIAFIENMGYTVNKDIAEISKQIEIPYVFNNIYSEYQALQKKAGYDLAKYAGSTATLYTYSLIFEGRSDVYAHLLVANNVVIGGDISALSVENGFIKPLSPA